jgi:Ca2+-transporting ATPase
VRRVAAQFTRAFTLLLLAAAVVSIVVLREPVEGGAILAIVFLNTAIAVVQEERAAGAIRALRALTSPTARVFRSGQLQILPAAELVPGDTVRLEAGDRVPADVELVESESFAVDESNLTGESVPAEKDARRRAEDGAPWRSGQARPSRAHWQSAEMPSPSSVAPAPPRRWFPRLPPRERPDAPLEREVRDASWKIATFAIGLGILIALIAWRRGGEDALGDGIFAGVALAIAAVPEGLLTVVTTALALGAHRMARRGAIVRRLSAIEGLGATSVLCVDKTGTLTEGALSVAAALPVSGREKAFWEASLRCNNASEEAGDPVDLALVREARKLGYESPAGHRAAEAPFDTATRTMATVHVVDGRGSVLSLKGAPKRFSRAAPRETRGKTWSAGRDCSRSRASACWRSPRETPMTSMPSASSRWDW